MNRLQEAGPSTCDGLFTHSSPALSPGGNAGLPASNTVDEGGTVLEVTLWTSVNGRHHIPTIMPDQSGAMGQLAPDDARRNRTRTRLAQPLSSRDRSQWDNAVFNQRLQEELARVLSEPA